MALSLLVGIVSGALASAFTTTASAATQSFTLAVVTGSATYKVHSNTPPSTLPGPSTLTGQVNPSNGKISDGTLAIPSWTESNRGTTETFTLAQVTPGSATGLITAKGNVSITEALSITLHITAPITNTCIAEPINVRLTSTSPYTAGTGKVTISATSFTIPDFTTLPNCGPAHGSLNTTYAGSTGNALTMTLQGTLPVPKAPIVPSTTTLTVAPAPGSIGNVVGQSVTLTATVTPPAATGTVQFLTGSTPLSATPVVLSKYTPAVPTTATLTTSALPVGRDRLTAVYSGDGTYISSTSPAVVYPVAAAPTVNINFPYPSLALATTAEFTGTIANPVNGPVLSNVRLDFQMSGISGLKHTQITLLVCTTASYLNGTGSSCTTSILTTGTGNTIKGSYGGLTGFALPQGTKETLYFKLSVPSTTASYGYLTATAKLDAVNSSTGTVLATLATQVATVVVHPAAAQNLSDLTLTVSSAGSKKTRQGYQILATVEITHPSKGPAPTGTITYYLTTITPHTSGIEVKTVIGATTLPTRKLTIHNINWTPGVHKVSASYSGDSIYNSKVSNSVTFTVETAPAGGVPYACSVATFGNQTTTGRAYVTAVTATVPQDAVVGSVVEVKDLTVTSYLDEKVFDTKVVHAATFGLTPAGTGSGAGSVTIPATKLTTVGTFTGSGTVTLSGTPGSVSVSISSLHWTNGGVTLGLKTYTCVPVSKAFTIKTVTALAAAGPTVTTQPTGQTVDVGDSATFSAVATGQPAPTVQWQSSTDGGTTWSNITGAAAAVQSTGATSTSYTTPATTGTDNDTEYRAVFTNGTGSTDSTAATLTVDVSPVVTTQPSDQAVTAGQPITFVAVALSRPTPTVQWQVSTDGGTTFTNVPGANSATLTFAPTTAASGNQYRAVFTNTLGKATTTAATLKVTTTAYRLVGADGAIYDFGSAQYEGSMGGQPLNKPIVGMADTPTGNGYWEVASDGGIFSFGDAQFYGSTGTLTLNKPVVGMAATPTGGGYWLVASDGGIFSFGDAQFYGSMGGQPLNKPIVGMAATPTGGGYWLVASDGGIFSFGNAQFYGSTGSLTLDKPIVGMAATPTGGGYWLVASDGGIFSFGNAPFEGSAAGGSAGAIVSMATTPTGQGYWLAGANGSVTAFGDAPLAGSMAGQPLNAPIVGMGQ